MWRAICVSKQNSEKRIKGINKAIRELAETDISGKTTCERLVKPAANYKKERKALTEPMSVGNAKLQRAE